jgi:hypothetical protein
MKVNLSYVTKYNSLGRSFFASNSVNKDDILYKLMLHPKRGELLACLINFKMYRTNKYNNIDLQNVELKKIERLILSERNSNITFDEVQQFVRNKSRLFQRQLPNHFKQAIMELIDSRGSSRDSVHLDNFLSNLSDTSNSFLEKNGIKVDELCEQLPTSNTQVIIQIKGYSRTNSNDGICNSDKAQDLLEKFGGQLGSYVHNTLVITLIRNCIQIQPDHGFREFSIAIDLLKKFGEQLRENRPDELDELVITLIKKCSRILPDGYMHTTDYATHVLNMFGNQLRENKSDELDELVITLIKNCSRIMPDDYLYRSEVAVELLEEFGNQLRKNRPDELDELVITLIKNCSEINSRGNIDSLHNAMTLLEQNSHLLSQEKNREIFKRTVENIFNSARYFGAQELTQFLNNYGNLISGEIIRNNYIETTSIRLVQAIRAYVQGLGQHRRINLPPRADLLVNGQPLAGIAFEVHNFTDGIESVAKKAIDEFLNELAVTKLKFTISDLQEKFSLIEDQTMLFKANNALNRILGSNDYKEKLELALPTIAAFLNLHHTTWETGYYDANIYWNTLPTDEKVNLALRNHYKDPDSYWQDLTDGKKGNKKIEFSREVRWCMWLKQSFIEAGSAYAGNNDTTSCVKGVYERLFTGFRSMHPIIDCLFAVQNIAIGFNNAISIWLRDIERAKKIASVLKGKGLKGTEEDFNYEIKQAYLQIIKEELKCLIDESLNNHFDKLIAFGTLKRYLAQEIIQRSISIINDTLKKINDSLDNLEYMEVNEGENALALEDYIKYQLAEKK